MRNPTVVRAPVITLLVVLLMAGAACGGEDAGDLSSSAAGEVEVEGASGDSGTEAQGGGAEETASSGQSEGGVLQAPPTCPQWAGPVATELGLNRPSDWQNEDSDPATPPDTVECEWEVTPPTELDRLLVNVRLHYWQAVETAEYKYEVERDLLGNPLEVEQVDLSTIADEGVGFRRNTGPLTLARSGNVTIEVFLLPIGGGEAVAAYSEQAQQTAIDLTGEIVAAL